MMENYLREVLNRIKPSEEEEKNSYLIINEFISKLNNVIKKENIDADVFLGGSFAKGTWLKNDFDIDLFVRFSKKYEDVVLSSILQKILDNSGLKYERLHGSREYFRVKYRGYTFEIVPIIRINSPEEARNVTDISPLHVEWVKRKLVKNPELRDEIRLAKYFFKINKLYGAESYIQGFSGYLLEVLIIYYNGFLNLIEAMKDWRPKVFIDIEGYYKNLKDVYKKLSKSKLKSPLIVIDPVDPNRNIASALSMENFGKAILIAIEILNNPNKLPEYFKERRLDKEALIKLAEKYGTSLIYISIEGKGKNEIIKNTKARKIFEKLLKHLSILNFQILDFSYQFDGETLNGYIFVFPDKLPKYKKHIGPPIWVKEAREKFLEKWKENKIGIEKSGRMYVIIARKLSNIEDAFESFMNREDIKEDCNKIEFEILYKEKDLKSL